MRTGQPEDPETTMQMNTLGRKYREYITLFFGSLTQTFGAALSRGNVAKVLRTGKNGTDFSHALCPASLKKKR